MKRDYMGILAAGCFILFILTIICFSFYKLGESSTRNEIKTNIVQYRTGEPPVGLPVMLYFEADDGTIYCESGINTNFAGILPFSITGSAVDSNPIVDWKCWTELTESAIFGVENSF